MSKVTFGWRQGFGFSLPGPKLPPFAALKIENGYFMPFAARRFKKILILVLCAIMVFSGFATPVWAVEKPEVARAACAYIYNITNSSLLFSKNADIKIYPGPTVKLMTTILVIEALGGDLKREIVVDAKMLKGVSGNNIGIEAGEVLTVGDLLNALIVGGSNDAASVLACTVAGSVEAFVVMMNAKALELGALNTVYTNVSGVHNDNMITTVNDTSKIALYLYKYGIFKNIAGLEYCVIPATDKNKARKIYNRNSFLTGYFYLGYVSPDITGMNAGYTPSAGHCVVATSQYNNTEYLCIVMGGEEDENGIYSYEEARSLLRWAYENFSYVKVVDSSTIICEIPVTLSANVDFVTLMPERGVELYLPNDIDIQNDVQLHWTLQQTSLEAPVESEQVVGLLTITYNNQVVARMNLITKTSVARSDFLYILEVVREITASRIFKASFVAFIVISIGYILINSVIRYNRSVAAARRKRRRLEK